MVSKNIFSFFAKSSALLALAAFMLAHNCVIVWGAESLRLGFSGATATQLAGSTGRRSEIVRPLRRERRVDAIGGNDHDSRFRFGKLGGRHRGRRPGAERLPEGRRGSHHQRAREHRSFSTLGEAGDFSVKRSQRKTDRQHSAGNVAQFSQPDFTHARRARSAEGREAGGVRPFRAGLTGAVHRRGRCRAFVAARYHRSEKSPDCAC